MGNLLTTTVDDHIVFPLKIAFLVLGILTIFIVGALITFWCHRKSKCWRQKRRYEVADIENPIQIIKSDSKKKAKNREIFIVEDENPIQSINYEPKKYSPAKDNSANGNTEVLLVHKLSPNYSLQNRPSAPSNYSNTKNRIYPTENEVKRSVGQRGYDIDQQKLSPEESSTSYRVQDTWTNSKLEPQDMSPAKQSCGVALSDSSSKMHTIV